MNIVLVGFELNNINELAMKLAKSMNYKFKNSENVIHKMLIKSKDFPIVDTIEKVGKSELNILNDLAAEKDTVISMSIDTFVSDDHYELFNNSYSVLIKSELKDEIKQKIERLVASKVTMVMDKKDATSEKLIKIIF